jgi:hypothetical protein
LKGPTAMSDEFRPNPANALFLSSPSPTLPVPPHIPKPFPMSVPSSPQLFVIQFPPSLPLRAHISPVPSLSSPASPPTTVTCLEKRAIKARHAKNRIRLESESSGDDEGKIVDKVVDGKVSEVQGLINMSEPWIEGPKSAKVSLTLVRDFFLFLMFLSIKNCRYNMARLGLLVSFIRMTKRPELQKTCTLETRKGFRGSLPDL